MNPIILIPARMASTRLPNKPLADIHGKPMIVHVMLRAQEANLGRVVVACSEAEVKAAVEKAGGEAVLTDPDLPSGSDRIYQALINIDPQGKHEAIINVQGDLPTIEPAPIRAAYDLLKNPQTDIGTLATVIKDPADIEKSQIVKVVQENGRAFYFTRAAAPWGEGPMLHHIGLYTYKRAALDKFVSSPPSQLEKREKLEQLRALSLGLRIDVAIVDTFPLGVDTQEDLDLARKLLA